MNLKHALETFVAEARDLLRETEAALLCLERSPEDRAAIDTVFRAIHTIKGSAGVFEQEAIVGLAHAMENILSELRAGRRAVSADLIALLLSCGDHLVALVSEVFSDSKNPELAQLSSGLIGRLGAFAPRQTPSVPQPASVPELSVARVERIESGSHDDPGVSAGTWHISVRFAPGVLKDGMDPLATLRYLGKLGKLASVSAVLDAMPRAADMDPEACYLGLEIDIATDAAKAAIEGAFEFLGATTQVRILPPHSRVSEYMELIDSLGEDRRRLGELLVASGALTERELERGLAIQKQSRSHSDPSSGRKIGEILVEQGAVEPALVDLALQKQKAAGAEARFLRVRAEKLDQLIDLVGELVIGAAGTSLAARHAGAKEAIEAAANLARLVEEVRDGTLRLRMVPIGESFARFERVVRDLSHSLGKEAELEVSGAETELDKSMVEKIADPLTHLVRNALDHGLETPEARLAAGKPARGRVRLNAYHESGSIIIEVSDDGAGLDRAKILARAISLGAVKASDPLSDEEVYRLVMENGFSTADKISEVSGRGVGMDVVRRNVEALRGSVSIQSRAGVGSTISMRLPLTLAIIDGFLVGVERSSYVVPLEMVVECIELSAADRARVRESGYINLRGEVLPLLRLREVFELAGEPGKRENIVVVSYAGQRAGLVVDTLLGESQTVIKPLGRLFERLSGISGSTILGTGEVALILDAPALVQRAVANESIQQAVAAGATINHPSSAADRPAVQFSQGS